MVPYPMEDFISIGVKKMNWNWIMAELAQIKSHLQWLTKQIHDLPIQDRPIHEYVIDNIKIEKVKGDFQIGKLFKNTVHDDTDEEGVYRFFIHDIQIREIEGTGTVGLGMTEKEEKKKKKKEKTGFKKVKPEDATGNVKDIYQEIKDFWNVDHIPLFFQRLATKPELLKKVWKKSKNTIITREDYQFLVEYTRDNLNHKISGIVPAAKKLPLPDVHKKIKDTLEADIKTLILLLYLLQETIPGYLDNLDRKIEIKKLKGIDQDKNGEVAAEKKDKEMQKGKDKKGEYESDAKKILKDIKNTYHLKELPPVLKKLKDHPTFLKKTFDSIVEPLISSETDTELIKSLIIEVLTEFKNSAILYGTLHDLEADDEAFLVSLLIWGVHTIPIHLFLLSLYEKLTSPQRKTPSS
jgi:hypothetical protein